MLKPREPIFQAISDVGKDDHEHSAIAATMADGAEGGLLPSGMRFEEIEGRRVEPPPRDSFAEISASRLYGLLEGRE